MTQNNLEKKDFENFFSNVNVKVTKTNKKKIHLHEFGNSVRDLFNNTCEDLPIIPKIYFERENNTHNDRYGQDIINKYYKIKNSMNKLSVIKSFILSILKGLKPELEKYNEVSKQKYSITEKNRLLKFKSSINETFVDQQSFIKFKDLYCNESFNLFKNFNENTPLFNYIFIKTYIGLKNTKNYFIKLFRKYIKERNILILHIKDNFGLLAFESIFDIDDISNTQIENTKNKSNSINYNKYYLYSANKGLLENKNKIQLNDKINDFNLMYLSAFHPDYYTKKHIERMERINTDIKKNITELLNGKDVINLYDLVVITINLDFNLLELMYYYCDKTLFNTAINNNNTIKSYIYNKLNNLDIYYDIYKDWLNNSYNQTNGNSNNININRLSQYEIFFDTILKEMDKNNSNNKGNILSLMLKYINRNNLEYNYIEKYIKKK
jgi:hypothetical protein